MPQPEPVSQSRQGSAGGGPEAGPSTARQSADISDLGAQGTGPSVYSKNRYKQDCALLLLVHHERERHADLAGLISPNDLSAAMGVYRLESARGKSELQAKAQTDLNGPDNLGSNLRNFIRTARFHEPAAKRLWQATNRRETTTPAPARPWAFPGPRPLVGLRPRDRENPQPKPSALAPRPENRRPLNLPAPPIRPSQLSAKPRGRPFRPCRHCGGNHYDPDCPTMRQAARAFQIAEDEEMYQDDEPSKSTSDSDEDYPETTRRPRQTEQSDDDSGKESESS